MVPLIKLFLFVKLLIIDITNFYFKKKFSVFAEFKIVNSIFTDTHLLRLCSGSHF